MTATASTRHDDARCDLCFERLQLIPSPGRSEVADGLVDVYSWVTYRQLVLQLCEACNRVLMDSLQERERVWSDSGRQAGF